MPLTSDKVKALVKARQMLKVKEQEAAANAEYKTLCIACGGSGKASRPNGRAGNACWPCNGTGRLQCGVTSSIGCPPILQSEALYRPLRDKQ